MNVQGGHRQDRADVVNCVRRWGGAASDAALNHSCQIFEAPGIEGIISYQETGRTCIAYGNPICSKEHRLCLAQAFHDDCRNRGKKVMYLSATQDFLEIAMQAGCRSYVEFGEELTIDPHDDPEKKQGELASLVRRKVRRAKKEEIAVHEYQGNDPSLKQEIENVSAQWLAGRKGLQIHTSNVLLFSDEQGKRWWYALKKGKVVGVAVLNELQASQGWLLNHLMVVPGVAQGTPEFLVVSILEALRKEGCHYVTFGNVAGDQLGAIKGLNSLFEWATRKMFRIIWSLFHLKGNKKFWEKYQPKSQPSYLIFSSSSLGFQEVKALLKALHVTF